MSFEDSKIIAALDLRLKRPADDFDSENVNKLFKKIQSKSILTSEHFQVNEEFVIRITKYDENIEEKAQRMCKILVFSSEWELDTILLNLSRLRVNNYPNLFIFIIENINFDPFVQIPENLNSIQKFLLNFNHDRPMILQIKFRSELKTRFYFKSENTANFNCLTEPNEIPQSIHDFSTFFWSLMSIGTKIYDNLSTKDLLRKCSLWLRLLMALDLPKPKLAGLIVESSSKGSVDDFKASIDIPFDVLHQPFNRNALQYLTCSFTENKSSSESSDSDKSDSDSSIESNKIASQSSILFMAIKNSNIEVVNYLIKYYSHLIQQLSFNHQVDVATVAYKNKQLDLLCDLVEFADFPFPKNIKIDYVNHERLKKIIKVRNIFHEDIVDKNFKEMSDFINNNANLKLAYNTNNQSAIIKAIDLKKYAVYFYLKSFGFKTQDSKSYRDYIKDEKVIEKAVQIAWKQTRKNAVESLSCDFKPIMLLLTRSYIHNKNITKKTEIEYRKKIKEWYKCIYNTEFGPQLLGVASQCKNLKIIFDFECSTIENIDVKTIGVSGTTYPSKKWIFVGAEIIKDGTNRDQKIKGVIAHELCHYVMRLIFQNNDSPYFENDAIKKQLFDDIVNSINKWTFQENDGNVEVLDDECLGIISSVYRLYNKDDYHAELIVRVVHLLAQFDNDEQKRTSLKEKYQGLFKYFTDFVLPEMDKFITVNREDIKEFNNLVELLQNIKNQKYDLKDQNNLEFIFEQKLIIVTTKNPKILLYNIFKYIQNKIKMIIEINFVFVKFELLKNNIILRNFKNIFENESTVRAVVDCSNEIEENLLKSIVVDNLKCTFIVTNQNQADIVQKVLNSKKLMFLFKNIDHSWNDLNRETQNMLLETKIKFQNDFILLSLLLSRFNYTNEYSDVINQNFLKLLSDKSEIVVNENFGEKSSETFLKILFQLRFLTRYNDEPTQIQTHNYKYAYERTDNANPISNVSFSPLIISQSKLLSYTQNEKYVLVSNIAGSGKSWFLKNIKFSLNQQSLRKWITYVDLKKLVGDFRSKKTEQIFRSFMTNNILKNSNEIEKIIFNKLYEIGKVCILFDGFDEIAPDYSDCVLSLAKSIEHNGGNQLWIATRDKFEYEIKKYLNIHVVYRLNQFTEGDGIELVASYWFMQKYYNKYNESNSNFLNQMKFSDEYKSYQKRAKNLVEKVLASKYVSLLDECSIGFPMFYKMIADVFKDENYSEDTITLTKIYTLFVQNQFRLCFTSKGELMVEFESQQKIMGKWEIHQYLAMKSYFPNKSSFIHLEHDKDEWPDVKIIAFGFVTKVEENFIFLHETFREFFAANFLVICIKKGEKFMNDEFYLFFAEFLTSHKFKIVRTFLNDLFSDATIFKKLENKIENLGNSLDKFINDSSLMLIICGFNENLKLIIFQVIKLGKTTKSKDSFINKIDKILVSLMQSKSSFQDFVDNTVECLQVEDLKKVVIEKRIIKLMMIENIKAESIKYLVEKFLSKIDKQVIIHSLQLDVIRIYPFRKTYLFTYLTEANIFRQSCNFYNDHQSTSAQSSFIELTKRFELIRSLHSNSELVDLFMNHYDDGKNFVHYILNLKNPKTIKYLWNEMQNAFLLTNCNQDLKNIVNQNRLTIFIIFGELSSNPNCAERFLSILNIFLKTIESREELQNIGTVFTFFIDLVSYNKIKLIEDYFETFEKNQLLDSIFFLKETNGQHLIQYVVKATNNLELFQLMWKHLEKTRQTKNDLYEVLKQVDKNVSNIFNTAAFSESQEIVDFLFTKLEKLSSTENVKELLSNKDIWDLNPLQIAISKNISLEINKILWNFYHKYFCLSEIVNMISFPNKFNDSLVHLMIYNPAEEVVRLTWSKINDFIKLHKNDANEELKVLKKLFKSKGYAGRNILQTAACNINSLIVYKFLWEITRKFCESNHEFVDCLSEIDSDGNNILCQVAFFSTEEIFDFTIVELEKIASVSQIKNILQKSNLWTQNAIFSMKSLKIYDSFMQLFYKYFAPH